VIIQLIPKEARKIIVAPLNWGLGHAARCIPIIKELLNDSREVILASDGEALKLLRLEFPSLEWHEIPAYKVQYNHTSLFRIILDNGFRVLNAIRKEHKACVKLVKETKADLVISDSRFGFRSNQTSSYIISHQLNPQSDSKLLQSILERGNRSFLNQFDACWVPDDSDHKLSGILSQSTKIKKVKFIGPLSRLQQISDLEKIYDLGIFLSGPEPARTKLENRLISEFCDSDKKICLIRGTEAALQNKVPGQWTVVNLASSKEVNQYLLQSKKIISRSGYTSIMDYYKLGISAYLIPTPGQTEQEYLAEYLNGKYGFSFLRDLAVLPKMI